LIVAGELALFIALSALCLLSAATAGPASLHFSIAVRRRAADDGSRSLSQYPKRDAKHEAPRGQGDRGDRKH
jgi:hypothetical protein